MSSLPAASAVVSFGLLILLAALSPASAYASVIVNVIGGGSDGGEPVRGSCSGDGEKLRSFTYSETWSGEKVQPGDGSKNDFRDVANESIISTTQENATRSEGNCPQVQESHVRRMLCMFVSGFSLAAGIIIVVWIGLVGKKKQHLQSGSPFQRLPCNYSFLQASSGNGSLGEPQDQDSTNPAEDGSSNLEHHNQPFRSVLMEGRHGAEAQVRPHVERLAARSQSRATASCGRSAASARLNMETAFSSTPVPSEVLLCSQEFWL